MVRGAVTSQDARDLNLNPQLNVDPDQVHLVVTILELDIIVDALRSVGNIGIVDRLEAILRQVTRTPMLTAMPETDQATQEPSGASSSTSASAT